MSTLAATLESVKSTLRSIVVSVKPLRAALKVLSSVAPASILGGKVARTFLACFDGEIWVGAQSGPVKMLSRVGRGKSESDALHCFPWDRFGRIANAIDPANDLRITFDDGEVLTVESEQVNGLRATFNLTTPLTDGIALPEACGVDAWQVLAEKLVLALDSAKIATGSTRPEMDGVLIRAERDEVVILAADGYQLSRTKLWTVATGPTGEAFIPTESVKALRSVALAEGNGLVSLRIEATGYKSHPNRVSVRGDGIILEIMCKPAAFPEVSQVIHTPTDAQGRFLGRDVAELVKAVTAASKTGEKGGSVEISSEGCEHGRIYIGRDSTRIDIKGSSVRGKAFTRSFDPAILLPYLKSVAKCQELRVDVSTDPVPADAKPAIAAVRFSTLDGSHWIQPLNPDAKPEPIAKGRKSRARVAPISAPSTVSVNVCNMADNPIVKAAKVDAVEAPSAPVVAVAKVEPTPEPATIPARWQDLQAGDRITNFTTYRTVVRAHKAWDGSIAIETTEDGPYKPLRTREDYLFRVIPSPVKETASVKAAAMAPETAPDTYTPIRPVAESATATPENAGHTETGPVVEPTIIRDGKGRIITRIATHDEATIGDVLSVPGGFGRIIAKRTREDGRIEYTTANQGAIAIHPSNDVELAEVLADPSPVSGGSPVAELPTVEIKGAAYTTEALPNGLALTKRVNGERHEATWTPDGVADCTCPAFHYTGGCKHLDYALKAGLIPTPPALPEPPATLPEPAPSDPCDIRPGHPEYTIEDEHARVRAIIVGAPILVYHLPESGPRRVETLGWVVADHVSRLLEIQRDGQHGRDDSGGVGWTAMLLWDAMSAGDRAIFAEWVDAIGYDPTEDFAGLPTEEQWDVFAGCCITGTPVAFPVPPGSNPGPGADATIFADQSRDFVAGTVEASPSPAIFLGCNIAQGNDLHPSPPPPEVFASGPIISRAPLDAIDLIGAHAMNTLPALSGGSDEASPGPKYASPGSIVLFWHCPACRKSGPVETALPAARPEVSVRARQDHRTDSPDCPGVPDVGFPDWMPEDGTPGSICLPISGGSPELPEDCPCPECGGSGVAGGQFTEGGEETAPCDLCECTGRYSPTELPEEEYDRLVAATTPSNERLRRMIRDPKPPEATAPPDRLVEDLEGWASVMGGPRDLIPAERDDVIVALREAAEEIRRLRARDATLGASCKSWLNAILVHNRRNHNGMADGHLWQTVTELRETIKAAEPGWIEPEPKP